MSKSATADPPAVMPSVKTWNAILKLAQQGQDCEKEIDNLQKSMKATKRQLAELGLAPKTTALPEWKLLSDAYTLTDLTLDSLRARLKDLSSQSNTLVCGAAQGRIFDDSEVDKILDGKSTATGTLYDRAMKSAQAAGVKPEVGESDEDAAKRKKPSPLDVTVATPKPGPKFDWRAADLVSWHDLLRIEDRRALQDAQLMNGADVEKFMYEERRPLAEIPGMSKKGAAALTQWIDERRNANDAKTAAAAGVDPGTPNGKHGKKGAKSK